MTRWGKPTKNKRRTNPRYRLDEFISKETGVETGRLMANLLLDKYYEAEGNQSVSGLKSWIEANREELARWLHEYIEDQASYDKRFTHDDPAHSLESIIDYAISIASNSTNWTDEEDAGAPPMAENKTRQPTTKTLMEGFKNFLNEMERETRYTDEGIGISYPKYETIGPDARAAMQDRGIDMEGQGVRLEGDGSSDIVTILEDGKISLYFKGQAIGTTHAGQREAYMPTFAFHRAAMRRGGIPKEVRAGLAAKLRAYQDDMPLAMELADKLEQGWPMNSSFAVESF